MQKLKCSQSVLKSCLCGWLALFAFLPIAKAEWTNFQEQIDPTLLLTIAEKVGDGGTYFSLVCFDTVSNVELYFIDDQSPETDFATLFFAVDELPPVRIIGYIERVDEISMVFVGVDPADQPAPATNRLIEQVREGQLLRWVVTDELTGNWLSLDEWPLKGASSAIKLLERDCI